MSEEGAEIPQEVNDAIRKEFGNKPEALRLRWNERFNRLADEAESHLRQQNSNFRGLKQDPRPAGEKWGEAGVFVLAKGTISPTVRTIKLLAELGAKATGGRKASVVPAKR